MKKTPGSTYEIIGHAKGKYFGLDSKNDLVGIYLYRLSNCTDDPSEGTKHGSLMRQAARFAIEAALDIVWTINSSLSGRVSIQTNKNRKPWSE